MTTITVRIDEKTKNEAKELAWSLGLNLNSLINLKLREFIETRKIEVKAPILDDTDPRFYEWEDTIEVNEPIENVISFLEKELKDE